MGMPRVEPWDRRDVPLFRGCTMSRMRRETAVKATPQVMRRGMQQTELLLVSRPLSEVSS